VEVPGDGGAVQPPEPTARGGRHRADRDAGTDRRHFPTGFTTAPPSGRRKSPPSLMTARHLLLYTKQCSPAHSSVQLCPGSQASLAFGAALRCEAPWHSRCTLRRLLPARGSQPGRGSAGRSRPSRRRARATARPGSGGRRGSGVDAGRGPASVSSPTRPRTIGRRPLPRGATPRRDPGGVGRARIA